MERDKRGDRSCKIAVPGRSWGRAKAEPLDWMPGTGFPLARLLTNRQSSHASCEISLFCLFCKRVGLWSKLYRCTVCGRLIRGNISVRKSLPRSGVEIGLCTGQSRNLSRIEVRYGLLTTLILNFEETVSEMRALLSGWCQVTRLSVHALDVKIADALKHASGKKD